MLIKLSIPGQARDLDISQFTGNRRGAFGDVEFRVNDGLEKADAWFVFEDADPQDSTCEVPINQVHFLTAEGSWRPDKLLSAAADHFFSQFSSVQTCHPTRSPNAEFKPPFLPWMVNANHESIFSPHYRDVNYLKNFEYPQKDLPLSMFCSAQTWTPAHRLRFSFAEHLKNYFGDDIAWFGNGVNALPEKWDGLARFSRTIVLENRSDHTNFTEKILDPFLAMTVPIYWGAPNIQEFLPVPKGHKINIHSFSEATEQIKKILSKPITNSEIESLIKGRELVLNQLHFLNRIAAISQIRRNVKSKLDTVTLRPKSDFVEEHPRTATLGKMIEERLYRRIIKPVRNHLGDGKKARQL
jgi:hypothetical protein